MSVSWKLADFPLTREDLDACGWQDIIEASSKRTCFEFATDLINEASAAGQSGEDTKHAALLVLGYVAQLLFAPESGNAVFVTAPVNIPKDNSALDALTDEHLTALAAVVENTSDPEMQARISDILWLRRRNPVHARMAVAAYLGSIRRLEDDWPRLQERLRRAAYLGHELGRKSEFEAVMVQAETIAKAHVSDVRPHLLICCCEVMLEFGHGKPGDYIPLCEVAARGAMAGAGQEDAERLWLVVAEWHVKDGHRELAREARVNAAEIHVAMADIYCRGQTPAHAQAAWEIGRAIAALSRIPGANDRVLELRRRLAVHEEGQMADMKPASVPFNFADSAEVARNAVRGKTFVDALLSLTLRLDGVRDYGKAVAAARSQTEARRLDSLFTRTLLDSKGRTVSRSDRPRRKATGLAASDPTLWNRMVDDTVRIDHWMFAVGVVGPARMQLQLEHTPRVRDWWQISLNSQFVPPGREMLWALGLHAGFTDDLAAALHLLVPQLEHALRSILWQRNVVTTSLVEGIEEEHDLGWLLDHKLTLDALGDTNVFHLRCLLDERAGGNLRNRTAHGLMGDGETRAPQVLYLWWFALRLCLIPIANRLPPLDVAMNGA
jgi:hypothetical protein